jgi:hypothetical protein
MEVKKNTTKTVLQKSCVERVFYQKNRQKSKTAFCRFFLSRFWAFLGEESLKTPFSRWGVKKKIKKI